MTENSKPNSSSSKQINWPLILLGVLLSIVVLLIYIGYDYLNDDAVTTESAMITEADSTEMEPTNQISKDSDKIPKEKNAVTAKSEKKKGALTEKVKTSTITSKNASVEGTIITHEVKTGETFNSIRRRYNISEKMLKSLNPGIKDQEKDIKAGVTKLKIKVKALHTVGPGDVFSKIAAKYGVKKELIMAANARAQDRTNRREKLIIPLP